MELGVKRVIGVSGFAGSGKDTLADLLVKNHGFIKRSLADQMKEGLQRLMPFSREALWGPSEEREKPDKRFVFSGICPRCHQPCKKHGDTDTGRIDWVCPQCLVHYDLHVTARLALQTLGTEWGRTLYPNIWIDALAKHIQDTGGRTSWVVSDVRFHNEVDELHRLGAKLVRIKRGGIRHTWHPSETEMAEMADERFDFVFENSGTISQLEQFAQVLAEST